ncbi:MAG: hypothetical protein M1608_04630 [Candidatus Omnitrophica bacterium]|nr:hypothetical protein [Candidatus Omnitrophota bacterium]
MAEISNTTSPALADWDYLVVTASNEEQARAYESQLALRRGIGVMTAVGRVMVVADPGGKRIGSGGSTVYCLIKVLNAELRSSPGLATGNSSVAKILQRLRLLIVHAGGDSKRLPAYGPCGKLFVPVPGKGQSAFGLTLFDRQLPTLLALPPAQQPGVGQVVVVSGDTLIQFDPERVRLAVEGITALGAYAAPERASKHGVFCPGDAGQVRLYLQKPGPDDQARAGAVNGRGESVLDIGVMSFDAATAATLLLAFGAGLHPSGEVIWEESMRDKIAGNGLDFYREICCALGTETTPAHYLAQVRAAGSRWNKPDLERIYQSLRPVPLHVQVLDQCGFLHFGTTRQLVSSGLELLRRDSAPNALASLLSLNNVFGPAGRIMGKDAWVEGCILNGPLELAGMNVVVGVKVDAPLALPFGACLDVIEGRTRAGVTAWFVRCYGIDDAFKDIVKDGATFCGRPVLQWLEALGPSPADVWDAGIPIEKRTLWDARVFPAETKCNGYRDWLWMYHPEQATTHQKQAFLLADRYSLSEASSLASQTAFHSRRARIRAAESQVTIH